MGLLYFRGVKRGDTKMKTYRIVMFDPKTDNDFFPGITGLSGPVSTLLKRVSAINQRNQQNGFKWRLRDDNMQVVTTASE